MHDCAFSVYPVMYCLYSVLFCVQFIDSWDAFL